MTPKTKAKLRAMANDYAVPMNADQRENAKADYINGAVAGVTLMQSYIDKSSAYAHALEELSDVSLECEQNRLRFLEAENANEILKRGIKARAELIMKQNARIKELESAFASEKAAHDLTAESEEKLESEVELKDRRIEKQLEHIEKLHNGVTLIAERDSALFLNAKLVSVLNAWVAFENEQIAKYGPYVDSHQKLNKLIDSAKAILAESRGSNA